MENKSDTIISEFRCPVCGSSLSEKRPKDKYIVRNKERIIRLSCVCGYYRDEVNVSVDQYKESL